jgi:hypothetical protein
MVNVSLLPAPNPAVIAQPLLPNANSGRASPSHAIGYAIVITAFPDLAWFLQGY